MVQDDWSGQKVKPFMSQRQLYNLHMTTRYSLLPSMLTYSVLYPSANIVQQKCFREPGPIDWHEVGR